MMTVYKQFLKPTADFLLASLGFLFLLPIFVLLTVFLFLANRGAPFFLQLRPGKDEKLFKIIKFKTMNDKKDNQGNLLPDAQRLTRLGTFIRKTSLDEIPQLINVIKGDMSLVGPRPLLPEYLPLYSEFQKRRHLVKPGITGWAQVNGRNTISWNEKFELDVWYVENCSIKLDLKILFLTVKKVLIKDGIAADGHSSMPRFDENQ